MKRSHVVRLVFIAEGVSKDKIPELVVHYSLIGNDMVYIAPPYLEMVGVLSDTKGITPNLTMTYLSRNGQEYPDEVYTLMSEKHLKLQANIEESIINRNKNKKRLGGAGGEKSNGFWTAD
jgi:hypothetical protein